VRTMFELGDLIKDDWVAAVEPQPSFAPFFRGHLDASGTVKFDVYQTEATGIASASSITIGSTRIPFPDLRTGPATCPR
jgi:hypothetical protein